jgi:hypothetical protein
MNTRRIYGAQLFEVKMQDFMVDWLIVEGVWCRLLAMVQDLRYPLRWL